MLKNWFKVIQRVSGRSNTWAQAVRLPEVCARSIPWLLPHEDHTGNYFSEAVEILL